MGRAHELHYGLRNTFYRFFTSGCREGRASNTPAHERIRKHAQSTANFHIRNNEGPAKAGETVHTCATVADIPVPTVEGLWVYNGKVNTKVLARSLVELESWEKNEAKQQQRRKRNKLPGG